MTRLTVHLKNVSKTVDSKGKTKLFNTRSFILKSGSSKEILDILSNVGEVSKSYISNLL